MRPARGRCWLAAYRIRMPKRAAQDPAPVASKGAAEPAPAHSVFYETERCVMAMYQNLSVIVWDTQATIPLVEHLEALSTQISRAHSEGISAIHVILDGAPMPTPEARQRLGALALRYAEELACIATVIAGDGFWASAMRGLITSLQWLERRPFKARTFATIDEVASWLPPLHAERTGIQIDPAQLLHVMASVRARITRS